MSAPPFILAYGSEGNHVGPWIPPPEFNGRIVWYLFFSHIHERPLAPISCRYGTQHVSWHPRTGLQFFDPEGPVCPGVED